MEFVKNIVYGSAAGFILGFIKKSDVSFIYVLVTVLTLIMIILLMYFVNDKIKKEQGNNDSDKNAGTELLLEILYRAVFVTSGGVTYSIVVLYE